MVRRVVADIQKKKVRPVVHEVAAVLPRVIRIERLMMQQVESDEPPLPVQPGQRDIEQRGPPIENQQRREETPKRHLLGERAPEQRAIRPPPNRKIERFAQVKLVKGAREKTKDIEPLRAEADERRPDKIIRGVAVPIMSQIVFRDDRGRGRARQQPHPVVEKKVSPGCPKRPPVHVIVLHIGGTHREPGDHIPGHPTVDAPRPQTGHQQTLRDQKKERASVRGVTKSRRPTVPASRPTAGGKAGFRDAFAFLKA